MPVYEYKCIECDNVESKLFPITSNILEILCSKCKKVSKRIISKSDFSLKGGGWYKDGYSAENK